MSRLVFGFFLSSRCEASQCQAWFLVFSCQGFAVWGLALSGLVFGFSGALHCHGLRQTAFRTPTAAPSARRRLAALDWPPVHPEERRLIRASAKADTAILGDTNGPKVPSW